MVSTTINNQFSTAAISVSVSASAMSIPTLNITNNDFYPSSIPASEAAEDDAGSEYLYILPSIIIFGVVGNVISLVAILHSRLRKTAANQYLILLTAADSVFLLALLMIWAKLDYLAYNFCVLIEYILQVASYVSKPSPSDPGYLDIRKCVSDNGKLQVLVETADVLLCYVIPCLIVVILNLLVAAKVSSAEKSFMVKKDTTLSTSTTTPETSTILKTDHSRDSRRQGRPNSSSGGSTRILLVVPVVYIILNTPFYLIRLVDTIAINVFGNRDFAVQGGMNEAFIYIHNTAYYLYYINFACDVIVYAFSSSKWDISNPSKFLNHFCSFNISDE
uniref:G-protein coupled receptors family 1 profile domain-containing protein n=1 Tax=Panagrolaimus davidi TaxID=227884 RepID=A0A914PDP7_9BILA